jgi:hypothetical protein
MTQRTLLQRASIVAAAAITATLTWLAITAGSAELTVVSGTITGVAVALTAAAAASAGWLALALLERWSAHPRRTWTILALATFAVSLLGPLGGTTLAAKTSLLALHAVVAAVVIAGLRRTTR